MCRGLAGAAMDAADGATIQAGMAVYDTAGQYIGVVGRVYPVPEPYARGDRQFGCFKVRRGRLPLVGPASLLVPFDAVRVAGDKRVTLTVTGAEAARWAQGRVAS